MMSSIGLPATPPKDHGEEIEAFLAAITTGAPPPIPLDELLEVLLVSIETRRQARTGGGDHE